MVRSAVRHLHRCSISHCHASPRLRHLFCEIPFLDADCRSTTDPTEGMAFCLVLHYVLYLVGIPNTTLFELCSVNAVAFPGSVLCDINNSFLRCEIISQVLLLMMVSAWRPDRLSRTVVSVCRISRYLSSGSSRSVQDHECGMRALLCNYLGCLYFTEPRHSQFTENDNSMAVESSVQEIPVSACT